MTRIQPFSFFRISSLLLVVSVTTAFSSISLFCNGDGRIHGRNNDESLTSSRSSSTLASSATIPSHRPKVGFGRWGPLQSIRNTGTLLKNSQKSTTDDNPCPLQQKTADILSLDSIRSTLIRQEETIIFALIERAQYLSNDIVYKENGFDDLGGFGSTIPESKDVQDDPMSFLEYALIGTEALHCGIRRYTSPEENAFFPSRLPSAPIGFLPNLEYPKDLLSSTGDASNVNFNEILLQRYIKEIVPAISISGDDEQHGSTVMADITILQALSRRVHYGKFVAESKYLSDPVEYQRLVDADDADGVMKLLTNQVVEDKILRRSRLKAATYGREPLLANLPKIEGTDNTSIVAAAAASAVVAALEAMEGQECSIDSDGGTVKSIKEQGKINPAVVEAIYRDIIIPLTKDIEVAYLYLRCGKCPPADFTPPNMLTNMLCMIREF
eukprot:CAMPEP_0194355446 /NCGR_PEP_ID=MMETSP0174-20130528/3350_1 /TAXON_ID=216777 /ORGANISM="Proboscia alata, Strain PI-D3" /LENGTH=440 /DNA_ID=CAMNT_0039124721 /DNA_START=60 /DNA_END=1385 /DNA_ORIENTATION=-